jgi:hypothetical protein
MEIIIMAFKFNAAALTAIDNVVFADAGRARALAEALPILRPLIAGKSQDEVRDAIITRYAATCGFETIIVERGTHAGRVGWPEGAAAQKKACQRFMAELFADESVAQAREQLEVPDALLQAALKLVKLANEYEDSKKLAAAAVAQAFSSLKA